MILRTIRRVHALALAFAVCCGSGARAQDPVPGNPSLGASEEELFELIDDEEATVNVAEMLSWLHENPIDLNSAQREDLLSIPGMTGEEADAILHSRESEGQFASVARIRRLPGGEEILGRIRRYVFVRRKDTGRLEDRIPTMVISSRLSGFLPGTALSPDPWTLGSHAKSLSRMAVRLSNHVKLGLLFEKDAGERFRDGFSSGYISFRGNGAIEQILVGDFSADAGQGLVLWRGTDAGRNGGVAGGIRKSGARLLPYHMADEAHYLRGGAIALKSKPSSLYVRCVLLASRTPLAATVNEDGEVTSFYSSGLFGTAAELEKRNSVHEFLAGTRLECTLQGRGTVGLTYYRSAFDRAVKPGSCFGFSGERSQVAGGDFGVALGGATFFGEIARTADGGTSSIAGVVMSLDSSVRVSAAYRNYSTDFNNPHARAYGVQANTTNERGVSIGWQLALGQGIALRGYADQCKIPGSSYSSFLPHTASDLRVEITALPAADMRLSLALRIRKSEIMQPKPGCSSHVQGDLTKSGVRFTGRMRITPHLEAKTRIEHGAAQFAIPNQVDKGTMISQALSYEGRGTECECGVTFYETDSYDVCLFDYEGNLRGAVPSPPLYGRGSRWHMLVSWDSFPWVRLAVKYAVTLRERNPIARELGVQAEVRF
ncbi:hypothetical protein EHM92_05835 [bacterium]|nr:MAG: hypothetical protein EHM92_05835 [bacterium]